MLGFMEKEEDEEFLAEEVEFSVPFYKDHRDEGITDFRPTWGDVQAWTFDSVCEATDGCTVEPDGKCEHGHLSWLRAIGMV